MMCHSNKSQLFFDLMPFVVTRAYSCPLMSIFRPDKKTIRQQMLKESPFDTSLAKPQASNFIQILFSLSATQ